VGVNTWLSTPELGYVLRHSGTRTLLVEPRFLRHDYAQSLAARCSCKRWLERTRRR
jgi:hypothetical protein